MSRKPDKGTAKRRKSRGPQSYATEHAAAYGVTLPAEPSPSERFLSPNDIGKILNLTGEAVKQWIYHRRLPAVKLANGYWKVRVSDFEAFLKARQEVARRWILLTIERDDPAASAVQAAVERLGHQWLVSQNLTDALLKAQDHHPALCIVNLNSIATDPWKLVEKMRGVKKLKNIPILFLSDNEPTEAEAARALELSAQGFLKRPFDAAILAEEIRRILDRTV